MSSESVSTDFAMAPGPTDNPFLAQMFQHPFFGHLVEACSDVRRITTWAPEERVIAAIRTDSALDPEKKMIPDSLVILTTHFLRLVPIEPPEQGTTVKPVVGATTPPPPAVTMILARNEYWDVTSQILVNGTMLTVIEGPHQTASAPDPSKWRILGMSHNMKLFGQLYMLAQRSITWLRD